MCAIKLDDVKYCIKIDPDAPVFNGLLRFPSQYLSEISPEELQTTHGPILLSTPYTGPKLVHNDPIMVLARIVQKGRFEGTVTKVTKKAIARFKQLCFLQDGTKVKEKIIEPKDEEEELIDHF